MEGEGSKGSLSLVLGGGNEEVEGGGGGCSFLQALIPLQELTAWAVQTENRRRTIDKRETRRRHVGSAFRFDFVDETHRNVAGAPGGRCSSFLPSWI